MNIKERVNNQISSELTRLKIEPKFKSMILNDPRVSIISELIDCLQIPSDLKALIITATALLQLSFDVHEHVSNIDDVTNAEPILQGDQLGGQYYLLLAEQNQTRLIQHLSSVTMDINQLKIQLNDSTKSDFKRLISLKAEIESKLIVQIIRYVNLSQLERYYFELNYFHLLQIERKQIKQSIIINQASPLSELDQLIRGSVSSLNELENQLQLPSKNIATLIKTELSHYYRSYEQKQTMKH